MCLNRVDCLDSVITARMPGGGRFYSHCAVAGKAILAFLPDEEICAIIKHGMLRFTSATLGKYADLMNDLHLTHQRGFGNG